MDYVQDPKVRDIANSRFGTRDGDMYAPAAPIIGELRRRNYSPKAIKNIIWHIAAESQFNPKAAEKPNGKGGNGFVQLTTDKNRELMSMRLRETGKGDFDLVKNPRALDDRPDLQAWVVGEYFDNVNFDNKMGNRPLFDYEDFGQVHRALAPKNLNPKDRLDWLKKNGWRQPDDADLLMHTPALDPNEKKGEYNDDWTGLVKRKINKDGTLDTPPSSR